jgi:hypothetical protein
MEYRAFSLDDNGHVFASEVIVAETDEEAMLRATRLRDRHDIACADMRPHQSMIVDSVSST